MGFREWPPVKSTRLRLLFPSYNLRAPSQSSGACSTPTASTRPQHTIKSRTVSSAAVESAKQAQLTGMRTPMLADTLKFTEAEASVFANIDGLWSIVVHTSSKLGLEGCCACLQPCLCRKLQAVFPKTGCRWQGFPSPPSPMGRSHITNKVIWGLAIYGPSLIALALLPMHTAVQAGGFTNRKPRPPTWLSPLWVRCKSNLQLNCRIVVIVIHLANVHRKGPKPTQSFLSTPFLATRRNFLQKSN